jgi:hypothetical protein
MLRLTILSTMAIFKIFTAEGMFMFQFRNKFSYSTLSKVFWLNPKILRIHTLPAICDSSLVGQLVSNLRPRHHHSDAIAGTDHYFLCLHRFTYLVNMSGYYFSVFLSFNPRTCCQCSILALFFFRFLISFIASTQ